MKLSELKETLAGHKNPKPIVIAEGFHFHKRDQLQGESVADYSAALEKYSERCQFNAFLEEALRDRFVCGLHSKNIQKRLLAEEDLTWKKVLETAMAMESAEKQGNQFRNAPAPQASPINALPQTRTAEKKNKPCFRCGGTHQPQTCRLKGVKCRYCDKKGHIEKVCKKEAEGSTSRRRP